MAKVSRNIVSSSITGTDTEDVDFLTSLTPLKAIPGMRCGNRIIRPSPKTPKPGTKDVPAKEEEDPETLVWVNFGDQIKRRRREAEIYHKFLHCCGGRQCYYDDALIKSLRKEVDDDPQPQPHDVGEISKKWEEWLKNDVTFDMTSEKATFITNWVLHADPNPDPKVLDGCSKKDTKVQPDPKVPKTKPSPFAVPTFAKMHGFPDEGVTSQEIEMAFFQTRKEMDPLHETREVKGSRNLSS